MSGADFFGLVVSVIVIVYLLYALLRGEKFWPDDVSRLADDLPVRRRS